MTDRPSPTAPSEMAALQGAAFREAGDYEKGSPHLIHQRIRLGVVDEIRAAVAARLEHADHCHVLEVGAGHGAFTDYVLGMGADAVVTEMSPASFEILRRRYSHNDRVHVLYDRDGEEVFRTGGQFDIVLCISVLHHIPEYLGYLERISDRISPTGSLLTFQDPLYYPRRTWLSLKAERLAFLSWRLWQGNVRRGVSTQWRRLRGVYDEDRAEDMVEYHVVRQGLDEEAIVSALRDAFGEVTRRDYWSTPGALQQRLGDWVGMKNSFALMATDRRC